MLEIKQKFHLSLPCFAPRSSQPMQLSPVPVPDTDDELGQSIESDPVDHDDNWQLTEQPDENELEEFWSNVQKDIARDPSWVSSDE